MKVAVVRYPAGNVESVKNALLRLGIEPSLTDEREILVSADKVIFPGVGEASTAMNYLREKGLDTAIASLEQPVLGICLGMHLLCKYSEENDTRCLGILPYDVKRFADEEMKVPHMGWNNLSKLRSPLFKNVVEGSRAYFVHSYFVSRNQHTAAETTYGVPFAAAVSHRNFYAVQFHPEKSGPIGSRILENFLSL